MNATQTDPFTCLYTGPFVSKLERLAEEIAPSYNTAQPYPHAVMDDFLPEEVADAVLDRFPSPRELQWYKFNDAHQKKLASNAVDRMDPVIRDLLHFLNSSIVIQFLERLTGIPGIIPDPYYVVGGLHQIVPGGKLDIHADFNRHEQLRLDRRLNLLVYLNKDWKEEYGGHFELWDTEMKGCVKKVLPIFNRCVVFSTTDTSFHGHPNPLTCPADMTRKSMALYYYTNGRPQNEQSRSHSTLFVSPQGEKKLRRIKSAVRMVVPPIIPALVRRIRGSGD
jgi:hypothetical protein